MPCFLGAARTVSACGRDGVGWGVGGRTARKAWRNFRFSGVVGGEGLLEKEEEEVVVEDWLLLVAASVRWGGEEDGRTSYSPVSQIRRLPVSCEADSMRWFWDMPPRGCVRPGMRIAGIWGFGEYPEAVHPRLHGLPSSSPGIGIPRNAVHDGPAHGARF